MKKLPSFTQLLIICFLSIFSLNTFAIEAIATVSKNVVGVNDPFLLQIIVDDSVNNTNIDLSPLDADFLYSRPSVSNSTSIINGKVDKETKWSINLIAQQEGVFTIPSLNINGLTTTPIKIQVVKNANASKLNQDNLKLEVSLDNKEGYIGESFIYTVQLSIGSRIESPTLEAPKSEGAQITQLGKDVQSEVLVNGRRYIVVNRQYHITPTQSGNIRIQGAEFSGSEIRGSGFNSFIIPVKKVAKDLSLNIKAKPANIDGIWLPTPDLQISQVWQPNMNKNPTTKVGEPINRIITLKVKNISQSSMPNLNINYPDSVKMYADKPEYKQELGYTIMQIKHVIVPRKAGEIVLPELDINWFNTKTEKPQTSKLAGIKLNVLENDNQTTQIVTIDNLETKDTPETITVIQKDAEFWPWLTFLFAGLWLSTLFLLWKNKRQSSQLITNIIHSDNTSYLEFIKAVKANNKRAIIQHFNKDNLNHLPKELFDKIDAEIQALQASRFSNTPFEWDNKKLLVLINEIEKIKPTKKKQSALADL